MESIKKNSRNRKISDNHGEATFLETVLNEPDEQFSPDELETTTPIQTQRKISKIPIRSKSLSQKKTSSSGNNKGAFRFFTSDDQRKRLTSSDDDYIHLKEDDLKQKLKEEKRQGKKAEELLTKLYENHKELLEKYAQAENTIDQLRFQPKIFGDNTPKSSTSEHFIHLAQQSKVNVTALRSSGAYSSPFSSIQPVASSTTTPARKSVSPTNSATIESVIFDEIVPDTLKADLFYETKSLGDKMKSFLVLLDENQLSLSEQKQVYEKIKEDYERLMKEIDQNKRDTDLDSNLQNELQMMKHLLADIVKKITQNLLGKSTIESSTNDNSRSSQLSVRSSICNHNDLMDQYKKLLNAVNTTKPSSIQSITNDLQPKSDQFNRQPSIKNKQKAYVYVSGDSDDEQNENDDDDNVTPIPYTKGVESTSFGLDYIPSTSVKHHQHPIEKERYENHQFKRKNLPPPEITNRLNDYDSGIGTNNVTKLSVDSKLYTSTIDESHIQSLDDGQESISSSRSSYSGSASPGSPYSKKFDKQSIYRRKPSGHSSKSSHLLTYSSHTETPRTGSFNLPSESYKKNNMYRTSHTWKPQKTTSTSHRSRLTPVHRSASVTAPSIEDYKIRSLRPLASPEISSRIKNNQSKSPSSYKSSLYINHTNNKPPEKLDRSLYLDPQTGIVYRYETEKNSSPTRVYYEPSLSTKLYRCLECGSVTNYHHRHHVNRVPTNADDPGYESGQQRRHHRRYRYVDYVSSSSSSSDDSDSDASLNYLEMLALNRAYNRAENIRYQSRCLSRHIRRQLKLAIATL